MRASTAQLSLLDLAPPMPPMPEGFEYRPDFVSHEEAAELMAHIGALAFQPFEFRGYTGRRGVVYFGWSYDFEAGRVEKTAPIPPFLLPLRARAAAFAGHPAEAFEHVLINRYEAGAGIGWHRDRPQFEDVVGLSLGAPARFRMRRKQGTGWERKTMIVEPRSAYLLRGPARRDWEHSLPPSEALRYSITFRTLRER